MGSDPDSTYFIMGVWPIKNPCRATGLMGTACDLFALFTVAFHRLPLTSADLRQSRSKSAIWPKIVNHKS